MHPALGVHEADLHPRGRHADLASSGPARTRSSSSGWRRARRPRSRSIRCRASRARRRWTRCRRWPTSPATARSIEAASVFGRFFTGQITAAGKVPPAKVLVDRRRRGRAGRDRRGARPGRDRARLRHARRRSTSRSRAWAREFVELDFEEEGEGGGGYAKEMSAGVHQGRDGDVRRSRRKDVDIIITTALIPGKPAPKLDHRGDGASR